MARSALRGHWVRVHTDSSKNTGSSNDSRACRLRREGQLLVVQCPNSDPLVLVLSKLGLFRALSGTRGLLLGGGAFLPPLGGGVKLLKCTFFA